MLLCGPSQTFDGRNRLIGRQDPLGRWHTITYDNAGRLWMQQDARGQITTHTYLNCGDESTRLYADGTRLTFSYNSLRQLTGVADSTGLHTFTYDTLNRLLSFVGPAHPSGQPITYGYDANSNRTLVQSWQGLQTTTYDPRDLLTIVQDPGAPSYGVASGTTTLSYDPRHQWIQQANANGTRSTVIYDALQRVSQIRHSTAANAEIAHRFYNYDPAGRLTRLQTQATTFTYGYDVLDQLTSETSAYAAPTPYSTATSYTYDANLRRIGVHSNGVLSTATYDAADQRLTLATTTTFSLPYNFTYADPLLWTQVNPLTTTTYDANGSPLVAQTGLFLTTYSWDAANRLLSVSLPEGGIYTQTYRFDDLRQRRQGPATTDTFVYAVTDPATQRDGLVGLGSALSSAATGSVAGAMDNSLSARWSSDAAPLLWWQRSGAASEWLVQTGGGAGLIRAIGQSATGGALNRQYHLDALGSTAATSAGTTETTLSYDAWGNRLYPTPGPFPGTPVGNVAFAAAATGFGQALSLTFSNRGYVALPPSVWTPTTAFSVSCRIQSTYAGSNPAMILGVSSPVAPQQFWLGLVNGVVYGFGYNLSTWVVGTTSVDDGNWHTVLVTYSGGVWTLFVDGVQNATGSGSYVSEPSVHVAIGALPIAGTYEFTGLIDEVALFNTVISATVPTSPWASNTAGLVALYHLDGNLEDSAQTSVNDNRLGFVGGAGYWQEPELGLAYVRARWLNEGTGSWLSVDPVSSEPRYSYAHNMPTTRVDPSGRQVPVLDAVGGLGGGGGAPVRVPKAAQVGQARRLYQEYQGLSTQRQRALQNQATIRKNLRDLEDQRQSRGANFTGVPWEGFSKWLLLGNDQPSEEEFSTFSTAAVEGLQAQRQRIYGAINQGHVWAEQQARVLLQHGKPVFSFLFPVSNVATADYRKTLAGLPTEARLFLPPPPGTDGYVEYRAGFTFGVADSLFSLIQMPLDLAFQILDLIQSLTDLPKLWDDLRQHVKQFFQGYVQMIKEAVKGDAFTQGKVAGRLVVDLILDALQGKAVITGFAKGLGRAAAVVAGNAAEKTVVGAAMSAAAAGASSEAEAAAKALSNNSITPETVKAATESGILSDVAEASSGDEPAATKKLKGSEIDESGKAWEEEVRAFTHGEQGIIMVEEDGLIKDVEYDSITKEAIHEAKNVTSTSAKNILSKSFRNQIKRTVRVAQTVGKRAEFWFRVEPPAEVIRYIEEKGGIVHIGPPR